MKMTITAKDRNLLLIVGGLLIFVLVYVEVFLNLQTKTETLEAETTQIEANIKTLEAIRDEEAYYAEDIENMMSETVAIKNEFPSNIMTADKILYAKSLEERFDMTISYLAINEPVAAEVTYPELYYMDTNGNDSTQVPVNPNEIYLYDHNISITFDSGYDDVKDAVKFVLADGDKKSIHDISLSYNSTTGTLSGTMTASMYQMTGTDVTYSRPTFTGISTGTDDLFKTMEITTSEESETEETEE